MGLLSRRIFIQGAGSAMAVYSLAIEKFEHIVSYLGNETKGLGKLIGASPQSAASISSEYKVQNNLFYSLDLDKGTHRELEIPQGLSHETLVHHNWPGKALIVEKDGPYASAVDYNKMQVLHRIVAPKDFLFSGNGIFSPSGKQIYIGAFHRQESRGYALVYDADTLQQTNSFATGGLAPSSFLWMDANRLMVGHYGLPPNLVKGDNKSIISLYDCDKGQVVEEIKPPNPNLFFCQMQLAANGKIFVLTHDPVKKLGDHADSIRTIKADYNRWVTERPYFHDTELDPSPLLVLDTKSDTQSFAVNHVADNFRWGLSLALNEKHRIAGGTHGHGHTLTFQNLDSGQLLSQHLFTNENPRALSITSDQSHFITTTDAGNVHYFDAQTRKLIRTVNPAPNRYNYMVHARCVT